MRGIIIAYLIIGTSALVMSQHAPIVNLLNNDALIYNPAIAGNKNYLTTSLLYRRQWAGFDGAPTTQILSGHAPMPGNNVGLGAVIYSDTRTLFSENGMIFNYAYKLKLVDGSLAFGLSGGAVFMRADWNGAVATDDFDPDLQRGVTRSVLFTGGAGFYYTRNKFYLGGSVPSFLKNHKNIGSNPIATAANIDDFTYMLMAGTELEVHDMLDLQPSLMVRKIPGEIMLVDIGARAVYGNLAGLGFIYRPKSALVVLAHAKVNYQLGISYAYEIALNELINYSVGGHELKITYNFDYKINSTGLRFY